MKRVLLFVGTNLAVMLVLGVVSSLFGLDRRAGGMANLLVFAAVIGMGGSLVSLFISKWMAKRSTGAEVITTPRNEQQAWLLATVQRQAQAAGIGMPEVAIYRGPEMNAFATGWNRNKALVAVSSGLLQQMRRDEIEAVLGHEISHVANGDMVTMSLLQGVLNTFVVFASSIVASMVSSALRRSDDDRPGLMDSVVHTVVYMVLQMVFGLLAAMIVMAFSRHREFRADAGGASLSSRTAMANALRRLSGDSVDHALPEGLQAMGISPGTAHGLKRLFMSHPPIAERIRALEAGR